MVSRRLTFALCTILLHATIIGAQNVVAPMSAAERGALIALYNRTAGPQWRSSKGWLGPIGSECAWEGVLCSQTNGRYTVWMLLLPAHGLTGTLPEELNALVSLATLSVGGNKLTGSLPTALNRRFDSGALEITGYASQFTAQVEAITLRYTSGYGPPCSHFLMTIKPNGTIESRDERCRDRGRQRPPTVFCEVRQGETAQLNIDRLVRFMETSEYFGADAQYDSLTTHSETVDITIWRMGHVQRVISVGTADPINVWVVNNLLFQIRKQTSWSPARTSSDCGFEPHGH